jgi:hypothetical protein
MKTTMKKFLERGGEALYEMILYAEWLKENVERYYRDAEKSYDRFKKSQTLDIDLSDDYNDIIHDLDKS